jgi:iron complex transport system ATP-binding protein
VFHVKHLRADNVTVRYRGRPALVEATLTLTPGSVSVIIGPNGSGKSTLLRCFAGIQSPSSGIVLLGERLLTQYRAAELRRHLAFVPQDNPMPFDFTVGELVALSGAMPERVTAALEAMDITSLRSRSVVTLSGGERQRAAIARAVAQETDFLLLDEPTAHLDLQHQMLLMQLARERASAGCSVVLILHDINLSAATADRLVLLWDGKIIADGNPTEILTPKNLTAAYGVTPRLEYDPVTGRPYLLPLVGQNTGGANNTAISSRDLTSS